jgi:hypothetical protein
MRLKLVENKEMEETQVTIEFQEKDESVKRLVTFVEHMEKQENKMGYMPVKRLIISMSLPMMVSMLVQALYNIVDSIFVSQINEQALTAVSLAFPLQSLMISVGSGTGVGINALLSKSLGEKKFDRADQAANNGLFLMVLSSVFFVLLGLFASGPFFRAQTQNESEVASAEPTTSIPQTRRKKDRSPSVRRLETMLITMLVRTNPLMRR